MSKLTDKESSNGTSTNATSTNYQYKSTLSRRDSLKWLGAMSAVAILPAITSCGTSTKAKPVIAASGIEGHWPELDLAPVTSKGYGKDPNLIVPPKSPWAKTLLAEQLTLVAILSDILVPRDGQVPSASEVNVPDVIDEWVSAPYAGQQNDRIKILSCLVWIDDESRLRFEKKFAQLSAKQQIEIIDDIAFQKDDLTQQFVKPANAFARLRKLVLAAFFCSPEGTKDLGYMGNVAIAGDYPGPTEEAMIHLNQKLVELGLS